MQVLTAIAAAAAIASAFFLYGISYDTRLIEVRVQAQERSVEQARSDIAVLKAERAHLARPERIEPLARAQGLAPVTEQQFVRDVGKGDVNAGAAAR